MLPKRWRARYNVYELTALIWQLYYINRGGVDWEGIFGLMTGALEEEVALHREHYAGMRAGGEVVQQYAAVTRIVDEFKAVVHYARAIAQLLEDPAVWTNREESARILAICREIKVRCVRTLEYLPLVAGIDEELLAGATDNGRPVTAIREGYWATPADRLAQLDRMYHELHALQQDLARLHLQVGSVDQARRSLQTDHSAGQSLFGPN
jgi:hypothetical protein